MRSLRSTVLAVGVAVGAGWSCGGGAGPAPPTNPSPTNFTINIAGDRGAQSFTPNPASAGNQMVVFRNNDTVAHRVRLNDVSVDWGIIQPGATSAAFRMPRDGANYHCDIHPGMIGSVRAESGNDPPPCQDVYCGG
jgi:plastocyanin